jgi:cytochrome d ubiquinol oxidase subunit II
METVWFAIVSAMLTVYVILDGFDFGVGILHRFVARTDEERSNVLAAIGPVWDGNEVWLIAAGGVLFMAFPKAYSAAFSGFYMALMIVLWLLILRGIAIESRSHQENPLWREFWDTIFSLASALLAFVLGTALGNVVRGVPVDETGSFAIPLFTNFQPGVHPGVFDWYTALVGAFTLCVLAGHGALYLVWKTAGPVQARSRAWARTAWMTALPLWALVTLATVWLQSTIFTNLLARPWSLGFVLLMVGGLWGVFRFLKREQELAAFLSSSVFLLALMAATMTGTYPVWLRSTLDPAHNLTATNTASDSYSLQVGLIWWAIGITLAGGYFGYAFHSFRGKVDAGSASIPLSPRAQRSRGS